MTTKGYIENGFIVDLSNAGKTSEIIYELSRILDLPEAKSKSVCLKLGSVNLNQSQLVSIKALVESMDSSLEFISTVSDETKMSAESLGVAVSDFENTVDAPEFNEDGEAECQDNPELENALDKIFGEFEYSDPALRMREFEQVKSGALAAGKYSEDAPEAEQSSNSESAVVEVDEETLSEIKQRIKETEKLPTLYIQRTLRSGQSLKSDGNIVIIGDVNPGAEVIAKGDITVWGILGGIAQAGSDGNNYSKIRALKLNAIQLRIGEVFARRPDAANIPYIQRTDAFVPEEARVRKNHIVIYKLHEGI